MKKLTIHNRTIKATRDWLSFDGLVWSWAAMTLPRQCWRFDYHKLDSGGQWIVRLLVISFGCWKKEVNNE